MSRLDEIQQLRLLLLLSIVASYITLLLLHVEMLALIAHVQLLAFHSSDEHLDCVT